jgi:hypothetical protein
MADDGFNGATVYFPASASSSDLLGPLRSISWRESGARADVTGSADTAKTYVVGINDNEVTISIVGGITASTLDVGDVGALYVVWNDGGTDGTLAAAQVSDIQTDGSMDGEIISQVTFVPEPA